MKPARYVIALTLCCILFSACASRAAPRFTARNADLTVLSNTLQAAHPNLYFNTSLGSFDLAFGKANAELSPRATPAESFTILARFVSRIGDAHTVLDPYTADYRTFRDNKGRLFPLELRFERSKAIVVANYEKRLVAPNNSVVLSIAGESIPQFLRRTETLTSGERPALRAWRVSEDIRALMWLDGFRAPFSIQIRTPDGRIVNEVARGCTIDDIHVWDRSAAAYQELADYTFRFDATKRIGILTIHNFNTDNAKDWDEFLQRTMQSLRKSKAKALVIDLRENDGGDTKLSDDLLKRFARKPFRDFSEVDIKVSQTVKYALGHDRYVHIYGDDAWSAPDGDVIREHVDYDDPLPLAERFPGKVYVITGSGTYSTAAIFSAAAQTSKSARILGQPSGGLATLYGEAFSFMLPVSKISATVSTKFLIAPDGNRTLHSVRPDKIFVETPLGAQDTELAQILQFVASL